MGLIPDSCGIIPHKTSLRKILQVAGKQIKSGEKMGDIFIYYGLTAIALLVTLGAQAFISASYSKYSRINSSRALTGADAARIMLNRHGLSGVSVSEVSGKLTDHYHPKKKQVNLSSAVYRGTSIASIAVACHECGHAIQDDTGYTFMKIRSSLVPVTRISSYLGYFAIAIGCIFASYPLIYVGIIAECAILLFQLVTLPVEINASRRALEEIKDANFLSQSEYSGGKTVLAAAALTYVASVVTSLLQILRLLAIFGKKRR